MEKIGPIAMIIGATLRNTANPTRLAAGYKDNVIPGRASATIDCRTLPGPVRRLFEQQLRDLVGPDIELEIHPPQAAPGDHLRRRPRRGDDAALKAEDPGALPVPYMLSGGTDAKAVEQARHPLLRLLTGAPPADLNFGRVVPWH